MNSIIYILSTNYAGSTALGLALGSHSQVFFLGEPQKVFTKKSDGEWRYNRFCSICEQYGKGAECPVWHTSFIQDLRNGEGLLYSKFQQATAGKYTYLADGSKSISWLENRLNKESITPYILHISKPVHHFYASVYSRKNEQEKGIFKIARGWVNENERVMQLAASESIPYLHIRYTDFATKNAATLKRINEFLQLPAEIDQEKFWEHEHHYIKGNPGTLTHFVPEVLEKESTVNQKLYKANHQQIFLDEKWKEILSKGMLKKLYALPSVRRMSTVLGYDAEQIQPGASGFVGSAWEAAYSLRQKFR